MKIYDLFLKLFLTFMIYDYIKNHDIMICKKCKKINIYNKDRVAILRGIGNGSFVWNCQKCGSTVREVE